MSNTNAAFVIYESKLRENLSLIRSVADAAGVNIILALKAFAYWPAFPIVSEYLRGATASSLNEALLVEKHMGVRPHVYAPAYAPHELPVLAAMSEHLTFNSLSEFARYNPLWTGEDDETGENSDLRKYKIKPDMLAQRGLRLNPEYSPVETELYNPADPHSRLGETLPNLPSRPPEGLQGVHVHTLCESSAEQTATLIEHIERKFGHYLRQVAWLNLGGGHLMTKRGYDIDRLVNSLQGLRSRYPQLEVILEPGSAIAWQIGELQAHVLDIVQNYGHRTALLDVSFTCHMPDTLEMPYRPVVRGASSNKTAGDYAYRLGGSSCLAGDYLDDYYFKQPLLPGDTIIFEDMAHYTTVKSNMFNGVTHPDILLLGLDGQERSRRSFKFEDYERRMG